MELDPSGPKKGLADLSRIGRYRITRPLSKGGMALVYEARRESLEGVSPRVAIKLILPEHAGSETFRQLFINEARLGASMQHQNLVQIQDFDCDDERYFLVMEYVEGLTLRRIIGISQLHDVAIPMGVIAEIGRQACDGLHYAHGATDDSGRHLGLVHRDIKPSNIILNPQGVVKILDFGISKGVLRQERKGSVKGTWGYMAPEQATGRTTGPGADVFGLATVLYELASRRPMFQDKDKSEIKRLLDDDHAARLAATLDPEYRRLVGVLVRALQRDPDARYGTAEDFARSLSSLLADPITARDEVTRFYEVITALDAGRAAPPDRRSRGSGDAAYSGLSSISVVASQPGPRKSPRWVLPVAAASSVAAALVLAVVLAGLVILQPSNQAADGTPAAGSRWSLRELVADEPAGPAGEGAPGEERPPPVVQRAAPPAPAKPSTAAPAPRVAPVASSNGTDEAPTRVRVIRKAEPETVAPVAAAEVLPQGVGSEDPIDAVKPGTLVVGAKQEAEIYISGQFVQLAPLKRDLPPGRYAVSIVALDGRRRTFEVEIVSGKRVRKVWDFDRMDWR